MGTALTDTQADALLPHHLREPAGVIVATDADLAGQLAAERDYWMLTARGGDPQHVTFPTGQDPASILANHGRAGLRDLLTQTHPLAEVLIDERLNHLPPAQALPAALTVVAASDAQQWPQRAADIAKRLHLPTDVALTGLLGHISGWDGDRHTSAMTQAASSHQTRTRLAALAQMSPEERWAPFARQINPALLDDHRWGLLAEIIDEADRHGVDVHTLLPDLANRRPLESAPRGAGGSGSGRASPAEDQDPGTDSRRSFALPSPPAGAAVESLLPEPEPAGLTKQCLVAEDVRRPLRVELDVGGPHVTLEAALQVLHEERAPHVVPVRCGTAGRDRRQIAVMLPRATLRITRPVSSYSSL